MENTEDLKKELAELESKYDKVSNQYFKLQDQIHEIKRKILSTDASVALLGKYALCQNSYIFIEATKPTDLGNLNISGPMFSADPSMLAASMTMFGTLHVSNLNDITLITENEFFSSYDEYTAKIKEMIKSASKNK